MVEWPHCWSWKLELSGHVLKRMLDRQFNEADLRLMLEDATDYHPDVVEGRLVIETRRGGVPWEVIVEPLPEERVLLVVTAYPAG